MTRKILFLSIIITGLLTGQDYAWPTNTGKQLTSNFGEFRDRHFHMGLDIRTNSSVGHPIYAVTDGYVDRIATNFSGYGKALYLKTNDDKIAVYGHLSMFSKQLEDRLFELQNENQSYFVYKYFTQEKYPVLRGEIIGYSGNSGHSSGPHLHFELRNATDQPLNPMTHGFPITDKVPPKFLDLALIPFTNGTRIDHSPLPRTYLPVRTSPNVYILKDTISVTGKFGFSTRVIDNIQNTSRSYQIEKLELLVDSISVFSVNYNLLDFNESINISTVYGQPVSHPKYDDFQKLYRLKAYSKLTIHENDKNGVIKLSEGIHKIEIIATDAAQNESVLTFFVMSDKSYQQDYYYTNLHLIDYPNFTGPKIFNPDLTQLENGVIFTLTSGESNSDSIRAFIEKPGKLLTFPLVKSGKTNYASTMINPYLFKDSESCGFLFYSDSVHKIEFDFKPTLVLPNTNKKIFSSDSLCSVEINDAIYDTTLMWITSDTKLLSINSKNRRSNIYKFLPDGIPYKNNAIITFSIYDNTNWEHSSIYRYNNKKTKWDFVESSIDTINNNITGISSIPDIFTILEDKTPPGFLYTYPKNQQTYSKINLQKFIITLSDDLSDINPSEENLEVYFDGIRIWVAYQPTLKEISYFLNKSLALGEHNLLINIQDRSGNSASKAIKFFIE
ncbi:MAG: M23 family metallopeptidase [Candidatus Neomarinimicrobiota bacterium]